MYHHALYNDRDQFRMNFSIYIYCNFARYTLMYVIMFANKLFQIRSDFLQKLLHGWSEQPICTVAAT